MCEVENEAFSSKMVGSSSPGEPARPSKIPSMGMNLECSRVTASLSVARILVGAHRSRLRVCSIEVLRP